jgi:hypothetical protein
MNGCLEGDLRDKDASTGDNHPSDGSRIHRHNFPLIEV